MPKTECDWNRDLQGLENACIWSQPLEECKGVCKFFLAKTLGRIATIPTVKCIECDEDERLP